MRARGLLALVLGVLLGALCAVAAPVMAQQMNVSGSGFSLAYLATQFLPLTGGTVTGQLVATRDPASTASADGTLRINPATSAANERYLVVQDNGTDEFWVDKEGDAQLTGTATLNGQVVMTLDPASTTGANATLRINPATSASNEKFIAVQDNGTDRFNVDKEGDVTMAALTVTNIAASGGINVEGNIASTNTGFVIIGESIAASTTTPTALSGDVNDYAGCNWTNNSWGCRIGGGAADRNITGIAAPSSVSTRLAMGVICNIGTTNNLVLVDESASSTAANRFALNANVTVLPERCVLALYDGTSARIRLLN